MNIVTVFISIEHVFVYDPGQCQSTRTLVSRTILMQRLVTAYESNSFDPAATDYEIMKLDIDWYEGYCYVEIFGNFNCY